MVKQQFNLNASIFEYCFARFVEDTNDVLLQNGRMDVVMASQGRALHDRVLEMMNEYNEQHGLTGANAISPNTIRLRASNKQNAKPSVEDFMIAAMKEVYGDDLHDSFYKGKAIGKYDANGNKIGTSYLDEYASLTGFRLDSVGSQARAAGTQSLDGYIPISPFDNNYAYRSTVLNQGTRILFAKASDMVTYRQTENGSHVLVNANVTDDRERNVHLYSRRVYSDETSARRNLSEEYMTTDKVFYRNVGSAYTNDDAVGLARLKPYMTDADYRAACSCMMKVSENERMSPQAMDRAVAILQLLTNSGVPYTVKPDLRRGQLKASISNTKQDIRLTDLRKNEQYIGRGYRDGISTYLGVADFAKWYQKRNNYSMTVDDTKLLVRYILGEQPDRIGVYESDIASNKVDGRIGAHSVRSYKGVPKNSTYVDNDKDGNSVLQTFVGYDGSQSGVKVTYTTKKDGEVTSALGRVPLLIKTGNNHSSPHINFEDNESAEVFLKDSIDSAKQHFIDLVDIDMLLKEAEEHGDDPDYAPEFSSDASIAPIQQIYWETLTGKNVLYRPTEKVDDDVYGALFEALNLTDPDNDEMDEISHTDAVNGKEAYNGTPEENIRAHLKESLDVLFGSYEPDSTGKRFNPALIASFMDSPNSIYRNNDNIVAAMYKLEFTGDELRGNDFQTGAMKDRLLRFDNDTAVRMDSLTSPFMKAMYEQVKTTLETTACRVNPEDVLIDENGVVKYVAYQTFGEDVGNERKIEGTIGQIFEPDEDGIVETHYNGSENKLFSPGYNAYVTAPEHNASPSEDFMSRVRLRGLSQVMSENIAMTIRADITNGDETTLRNQYGEDIGVSIGTTTSINNTYRKLYSTGYRVMIEREEGESLKDAFVRQCDMTGLDRSVQKAIFETNAKAFRFPNEYRDSSTVDAEARYSRFSGDGDVHDLTNDNVMNYYNMTNHTNLAVTQSGSLGYTDDVQTGSGKNQGIVRYLGVGVEVNPVTGEIIPVTAKDENGNEKRVQVYSPLRQLLLDELGDNVDAKPADRAQMVTSNLQSASGVAGWTERELSDGSKAQGVGVAQLTVQGLTFDDGALLSKKFADEHQVVIDGGKLRSLVIGDKVCDLSGNKSIVAKIIDPDMDPADAKEQGIDVAVELFKANPDLDVVQAPYSGQSRFNAASALLAMRNPKPLVLPDGTVHEGCLGFAPMIITKHTANDHTKMYDEEQDVTSKEVKGRKISAQLGWVLSAKNSKNLMAEIYSSNNSAPTNFREVINVLGLDMDEVGTLRKEYQPHNGEDRHVFHLPDEETLANTSDKDLINLFRDAVDSKGGFLELPFPLELKSGVLTPKIPAEKSSRPDRPMYQFPVLSSHLRSGQTFEDGTSKVHDYTNQYAKIFTSALRYLKAEAKKDEDGMRRAIDDASSSYEDISSSLISRKFETKHNMMRDEFMSKRMPHSATAVWTPATNLKLNQVAMNSEMMKNMGVKEGDHVMIWRDPILRDYGTRYMEVKRDDNLCGVAVHPLVAVAFDGDFDGDSVGMWKPSWKASQQEAMEQYSLESTMLDFTQKRENGDFALIFNTGMDVRSAEYWDNVRAEEAKANGEDYGPTLEQRRLELEHKANEIYRSDMSPEERLKANREVLDGLSDWAHDTLCNTCGTEIISYNSLQEHIQSMLDVVNHGAKGSMGKMKHYTKYMGVECATDKDGNLLAETARFADHPLITEQDIADTEKATAIKSHGTGLAGTVSQRIVRVLRNTPESEQTNQDEVTPQSTLSSALQLTYLSTQGILQAKHDPVQAQILYDSVKGPIREVWRGHALERKEVDGKPVWTTVKQMDSDGNMKPVQATKEQWIQSFMDLHTDPSGLDLGGVINLDHVKQVAEALYNPDTGRMYDIEDDKTIERLASAMDILAYGPTNAFDTLCHMADEHVNIFEGSRTALFMPKNISKNLEILKENEEKLARGEITADELHQGMRPIIKSDTRADYDVHAKVDVSKAVIGLDSESVEMAAAKGIEVPAPEPVEHVPEEVIEDTVAEPVDVMDSTVSVEDIEDEPVVESVPESAVEDVPEASEPVVSDTVSDTTKSVADDVQTTVQLESVKSEKSDEQEKPVGFAFDKAVEKTPEKMPEPTKAPVSKKNPLPDVSDILANGNDGSHGGLGE